MFLNTRLFSLKPTGPLIAVAAATFTLGLMAGAVVSPSGQVFSTAVLPELPAWEDTPAVPTQTARGTYAADVVRVFDGDTFEARVRIWPGLEVATKVRLRGVDAPELKARCEAEQIKAEAAREALRALLAQGEITIARVTLDKYGGRVVADASTRSTADVSQALLGAGLVRSYGGGRRESWCAQATKS
jgi:endonuclease YncB( thermonuclease family)